MDAGGLRSEPISAALTRCPYAAAVDLGAGKTDMMTPPRSPLPVATVGLCLDVAGAAR